MEAVIRQVLAEHARLNADVATIGADDDLFRLGLTSHSSVNVMLALEDMFLVEFPDNLLRRSTFESISSMQAALASLDADPAAVSS